MSNEVFNKDYMSDVKKEESDKVNTVITISGDNVDQKIATIVGATLIKVLSNETFINYESDGLLESINDCHDIIAPDVHFGEIKDIDTITINAGDPEANKVLVKAIFKITATDFNGEEFDSQPLKEIYGNITLIQSYLESGDLYFYVKESDYAFWKYKFQGDIVGGPDDYIVLYGNNELEIVRGEEYLLTHYRLPKLNEALNIVKN